MSIMYATPAELAAYVDPDAETPPAIPKATILIRRASYLVLVATRGARYATDANGVATDAKVYAAMHEATMEQASVWAAHGIDPTKGAAGAPRQVSSKALNGAQAAYVADPTRDTALSKLWAADSLTDTATAILRSAGLITSGITSVRSAGVTNTPAVVGGQSIYGGRPSDYYGPEPIPGVNI